MEQKMPDSIEPFVRRLMLGEAYVRGGTRLGPQINKSYRCSIDKKIY